MKKIFSKNTLIIAGITYASIALTFLIGYLIPSSDTWPSLRSLYGITLSIMMFPFIVTGGIIYIVIKLKPNVKPTIIGYLILIAGIACCILIGRDIAMRDAILGISASHIEGNLPEDEKFDEYLHRDIKKYFSNIGNNIEIEYELLRKKPTQVGVSLPKYYIWVRVYEKNDRTLITEGVMRVAAVKKQGFDVTNYLEKNKLKSNIEAINDIFPQALHDEIKKRAKL